MELKQIENALGFSNILENRIRENFRDLFKLLREFVNIYDEETDKLPYHINVIDELHADENSHSRIFAKLLRYQENYKFVFLEKFLKEVCDFNICVEKPIVKKVDSCGRIDIPIFDIKYVVLIENKVTDKAPDQNKSNGGQLARYIETIKSSYERKLEEIHVVYTPKYTREPSEESWKNKDNFSYKTDFKLRFCSVSYRDGIYPWLKNAIFPNLDKTNVYLYSAIEQYIDHLEGMFSLRIINKTMNMRLQEFIKNELGIQDENLEEAIVILSEKETELNNAMSQIQQLKSKYKRQIVEKYFKKFKNSLKEHFPNLEIVEDKFKLDKNFINVGVKFFIDGKELVAIIECNNCDEPRLYFGIGRHFASSEKFAVSETLQKILNDNELLEPEDLWCGWKFTTLDNAYSDLNNLICQILGVNIECTNG